MSEYGQGSNFLELRNSLSSFYDRQASPVMRDELYLKFQVSQRDGKWRKNIRIIYLPKYPLNSICGKPYLHTHIKLKTSDCMLWYYSFIKFIG